MSVSAPYQVHVRPHEEFVCLRDAAITRDPLLSPSGVLSERSSGKSELSTPPTINKATPNPGVSGGHLGSNNEALLSLPTREVSLEAYSGTRMPILTQQ